ncbi:protein-glutamate O-methyltransferase CheR [Marichromatium sp. AB32]|uniref:CheR family methyltransferase n=1 Tax=Marichromatium sp. AB32 TaxID=2483363 RepID=UPI00167FF9B7|nr:protein-glutamate O-methyltransferase CheR [Marichromatium sp. AB32]
MNDLSPLRTLIKERIGLHFDAASETTLREALARRIAHTASDGPAAYLARLRADETELMALGSLLTINETYFYREAQHLELLTDHLIPTLRARDRAPPETPIRILSAGCSSGEEPYSIAIALEQRLGAEAAAAVRISAGDLDPEVLERARAGRYGTFTFRALDPALRARHFTRLDNGQHQLAAAIRARVDFLALNLLARDYPPGLQGQDVIFYRNVSIYFDPPTRAQVLAQLARLLNPGGFLIVGVAETLANDIGLLRQHVHRGIFYFSNDPLAPPARALAPSRPVRRPPPPLDPARCYTEALALARAERYTEALTRLAMIPLERRSVAALELRALLEFETGAIAAAQASCEQALASDPWSLEALLVSARCARRQGRTQAASTQLARVIYVQPECWRAHYQLAELHRDEGAAAPAAREYRIARNLLTAEPPPGAPRPLLPSALSRRDLRLICERHLARLAAQGAD